MADNELLIKINADSKNATKAFEDVRKESEALESQLTDVAKISGAAFAAFSAEVGFSVHAFFEAEQASKQLSLALQNQGIFTEELKNTYKGYAEAVQAATGIDDDVVIKSQAVAQQYLGQTKITKDLTFAIANLAQEYGGNLDVAAEKVAKTIGTGVNAFAREGLVIDETATRSERYTKVLEFLNTKYKDLAIIQGQANGGLRGLQTAFGNLQEEIGARFAPVITLGITALTNFFNKIRENKEIVNLTVALVAAGLAISALGVAIPLAVTALGVLRAALAAMEVSATAGRVAIYGLAGATGIGLVVVAITELVLHWGAAWATIKAVVFATVNNISELLSGFSKLLAGAFTLDPTKIKAGLDEIKNAFKNSKDDFVKIKQEETAAVAVEAEKQDEVKKQYSQKEIAEENRKQSVLKQIRQASNDLLRLEVANASKDQIELKTQEIATLKALEGEHSAEQIQLLTQKLDTIRQLESDQQSEDIARTAEYLQLKKDQQDEFDTLGIEANTELKRQQSAELQASLLTDADAERKILADSLKLRVEHNNQLLIDRKKYGEAVALINAAINTAEIQGLKSATGELTALTNSKNETLKGIGKAAAITQITIRTAESAINIFEGFSTIPYIGYALGIAGAAAAIAYGAEQIGNVTAAAQGGLITGGIPGKDSVPALLTPGELVVPEKNFDQVVGAVQGQGQSGSDPELLATMQRIESKISTPQTTIIQGDVHTDDSYVDALVKKISDAIEFRNAKIVGVNV